MIDETNISSHVMEASGNLKFRERCLKGHFEKHVLNRDEKWKNLLEFEAEDLRLAEDRDSEARIRVARTYESMLSKTVVTCCQNREFHWHILLILPLLPQEFLKETGTSTDREPEQLIKCFISSKNLVIIASSFVRNGEFDHYFLRTGYRITSKIKKMEQWRKLEEAHGCESARLFGGKIQIPIEDHWGIRER